MLEEIKDLQKNGFGDKHNVGNSQFYYPKVKKLIDKLVEEKKSFTINRDIGNIAKKDTVAIEHHSVISVISEFEAIEYGLNIYSTTTGAKIVLPQSDFILIIDSIEGIFEDIESLKKKASELEKKDIYNKPFKENELGDTTNHLYTLEKEKIVEMMKNTIADDMVYFVNYGNKLASIISEEMQQNELKNNN